MKKKGFTLVELLAVIAILAILVIMALPAVLRMYRQSRVNNFQNEVRSTYRAAQSQFLSDSMLLESGQKILYTNGCASVTGVDLVKTLDMTGNSNFKYYVLINVDGKVLNVKASNGTYSYAKKAEDSSHDIKVENIDVVENNQATLDSDIISNLCPSQEENYIPSFLTFISRQNDGEITKGDEVAIDSEHFYVVSSNEEETVLFAKYNLLVGEIFEYSSRTWTYKKTLTSSDNGYGLQNESARGKNDDSNEYVGVVAFSGNKYWYNNVGDGKKYEGSYCTTVSSCADIYDSSISEVAPSYTYSSEGGYNAGSEYSIAYYVERYVNKLKELGAPSDITGRLIRVDEISKLSGSIYGGGSYWLASPYNGSDIWRHIVGTGYYNGRTTRDSGTARNLGVRPIIIIPTSEI